MVKKKLSGSENKKKRSDEQAKANKLTKINTVFPSIDTSSKTGDKLKFIKSWSFFLNCDWKKILFLFLLEKLNDSPSQSSAEPLTKRVKTSDTSDPCESISVPSTSRDNRDEIEKSNSRECCASAGDKCLNSTVSALDLEVIYWDPSSWRSKDNKTKQLLVERGPIQVKDIEFPATKGRRFSTFFYTQKLPNGQTINIYIVYRCILCMVINKISRYLWKSYILLVR